MAHQTLMGVINVPIKRHLVHTLGEKGLRQCGSYKKCTSSVLSEPGTVKIIGMFKKIKSILSDYFTAPLKSII